MRVRARRDILPFAAKINRLFKNAKAVCADHPALNVQVAAKEKEIQYILYPMKKIDFFEELTIDYGWYATTYDDLHVCDCGSSNCKRIIHKNGKMFTRNGLQYIKLENQDAVVWPKYRYLPLNHGVGARVWEFLDDLDITDLNIIRARAEYFKKCKPDDSSIIKQHSRL